MSEPHSGGRPRPTTDIPVAETAPEAVDGLPPTPETSPAPEAPEVPAFGTPPRPDATDPGEIGSDRPGEGGPTYGPPAYGPPAYGPPNYRQGTTPGYPPRAMSTTEERNWAVGAHLSGFVAAYVALGFIGPLVVLLASGNRSPFVRRHALEALNFNLSILVYVAISVVLVLLLIGIPMLITIALLYLVTTIQGSIAASRGEEYRYPLTIRFIN